jgi:uncharacterized protein YrzB (UPF0473 family)
MAQKSFKVVDETGKETEMEVLFTYKHEASGKDYVIYFDPKDEQGNLFAAGYDDKGKLFPVENEAEWKIIEEVTQNYLHENHHGHDHDHSGHDHDHDHSGHDHSGHDHSGHDHSGHDHSGHDHSGHDHSGHDHSGHDHSHHDHGEKKKK